MTKRNVRLDLKALAATLVPTPKLVGGPARGTRIPERIEAATRSGAVESSEAPSQVPKGKGKKKEVVREERPAKKAKVVGETLRLTLVRETKTVERGVQPSSSGAGATGESRLQSPGSPTTVHGSGGSVDPVLVPTRTPQPIGPMGECCINFRSLNGWFPSAGQEEFTPPVECFKSFHLPQDNEHFNGRTMGSLTDEMLAHTGQLTSILLRVGPTARQQSVELNEERRKRIANFKRAEELNARVQELDQVTAEAKETQRKLEEAEEVKRQLEAASSIL